MPRYRIAIRRTRVDQVKARDLESMDYRELQKLAVEKGLSGKQSADALREALREVE